MRPEPGVPYPVDDAAVHQVFPGGWIWILRFNNGITSAGAAVTTSLARELKLEEGAAAWHRLLDRLPSVKAQFAGARPTLPFVHAPRVAFRSRVMCGERWAMLPSAAGVIDPLLSTGFPLTLLGVGRLVELLQRTWDGPGRRAALDEYAQQTQRELDTTERLVAALYAAMATSPCSSGSRASTLRRPASARRRGDWAGTTWRRAFCCAITRRLARPRVPSPKARCGRPTDRARAHLFDQIDRAIEPFDVAGLGDDTRRDWYPVLADDLIAGRDKLGASETEIDEAAGTVRLCGGTRDCRLQIAIAD